VTCSVPHVRVAALETDREFGLSVLRRLQAEIEARGDLFKQAGVTRIAEYHARGEILPRILVVMDEFQVLFSLGDRLSDEAARLFEDLTRRGAAFGLHILLSSQSPSNAGTHSHRIYNQLGLRIALQCLPQDARAILGEGNEAASELERPGEAIFNARMGDKNKNVLFRAAWLELDQRRRYLNEIRKLASGKTYPPPLTFEGRAPARLAANPDLQALLALPDWTPRTPTARVWLGEPVEIKSATAATLQRYGHSNLVIVGGEDASAYGLMTAALLSLAAQRSPSDAHMVVADLARPDSPFAGLFVRLTETGAMPLPHPLQVAGARQAGAALAQLITLLAQRQASDAPIAHDIYFFILGLQRWREARSADILSQTEVGKQLVKLADEGPELGIHLLVSVDGVSTLDRVLKRGSINYFDLRVALNLPEQDSIAVFEKNVAKDLEENRALFRDEDEPNRLEKFKPYVLPDAGTMTRLTAQLRAKRIM
jgi:DNA segregation ATPase FtsK/SpoIIIE, S-DNA-T family